MAVSQLASMRHNGATAATLLFERLPDRLFAPLSSANRHRYWALLCRLYDKRFGPDAPLPPSHGFSTREITQDIEDELLTQDMWQDEDDCTSETPINIRANQVFHRLEESGWFRLEKIGIERRVTMRPTVSQFLTALVTFAEAEPVFLSAKIRGIEAGIKQVIAGEASGDTLSEMAKSARNLLEHVRNTGTNVRDIMEALSAETTTSEYVRRFFNDYIEQVFIGDYRELRTRDHPLSRRPQILRVVEEISTTTDQRDRLIAWYETKRTSGDRRKAEILFEKDIHRLLELSRIDEYLDRLDDEIRRANRRALAYLDYRLRSVRPMDHLIRQAITETMARRLPVRGDPFPPGDMISGDRLAEPRKVTERPPASSLRRAVPSDESIARSRVMLRARDSRAITPPKLADFTLNQLAGRVQLESGELRLASIPDIRAYQTLSALGLAMSSGSRRLVTEAASMAKGFRVRLGDTPESEDVPLTGRAFIIERRKAPTEKR